MQCAVNTACGKVQGLASLCQLLAGTTTQCFSGRVTTYYLLLACTQYVDSGHVTSSNLQVVQVQGAHLRYRDGALYGMQPPLSVCAVDAVGGSML